MTSKTFLSSSLLAILLAACNHGASTGGGNQVATAGAARSHGDLMPGKLVPVSINAPTAGDPLIGSDALAPRDVFSPDSLAQAVSSRGFQRVMSGSDPSAFTLPIDNPVGARILVRPLNPQTIISSLHMHSVATGLRLDHARDASNTDLGTHGTAPGTAVAREPSFAPLVNTRTLSFDEPFQAGLVQIDVPPDLAAAGILVEVQEPNAQIVLTGQADELAYSYGDQATLTFSLADDGAPIDGATVTASMELPNHSRMADVTLSSVGRGQYQAVVPLSFADASYIGAWGIHMRATGSFNGVAFERTVEAGLGYWPAHAQMTGVGVPVIVRGGDGLIDEVSVDVGVATLATDQFSVRGVLTFTGQDGQEHMLASAQTGQVVTTEGGTITLHFAASSIAFAQANGPFHVRDLALVSQALGTVQNRIGRGLDLATGPIAASEIRMPVQIPLHVQELIANGDLAAPTTK